MGIAHVDILLAEIHSECAIYRLSSANLAAMYRTGMAVERNSVDTASAPNVLVWLNQTQEGK
jgi:hypothetical protein